MKSTQLKSTWERNLSLRIARRKKVSSRHLHLPVPKLQRRRRPAPSRCWRSRRSRCSGATTPSSSTGTSRRQRCCGSREWNRRQPSIGLSGTTNLVGGRTSFGQQIPVPDVVAALQRAANTLAPTSPILWVICSETSNQSLLSNQGSPSKSYRVWSIGSTMKTNQW